MRRTLVGGRVEASEKMREREWWEESNCWGGVVGGRMV